MGRGVKAAMQCLKFPRQEKNIRRINKHACLSQALHLENTSTFQDVYRIKLLIFYKNFPYFPKCTRHALEISHFNAAEKAPQKKHFLRPNGDKERQGPPHPLSLVKRIHFHFEALRVSWVTCPAEKMYSILKSPEQDATKNSSLGRKRERNITSTHWGSIFLSWCETSGTSRLAGHFCYVSVHHKKRTDASSQGFKKHFVKHNKT